MPSPLFSSLLFSSLLSFLPSFLQSQLTPNHTILFIHNSQVSDSRSNFVKDEHKVVKSGRALVLELDWIGLAAMRFP